MGDRCLAAENQALKAEIAAMKATATTPWNNEEVGPFDRAAGDANENRILSATGGPSADSG